MSDKKKTKTNLDHRVFQLRTIIRTVVTTSVIFFFSSRRRHTRLTCDWSSDVCSSDLVDGPTYDVGEKIGVVRRAIDDAVKKIDERDQSIQRMKRKLEDRKSVV